MYQSDAKCSHGNETRASSQASSLRWCPKYNTFNVQKKVDGDKINGSVAYLKLKQILDFLGYTINSKTKVECHAEAPGSFAGYLSSFSKCVTSYSKPNENIEQGSTTEEDVMCDRQINADVITYDLGREFTEHEYYEGLGYCVEKEFNHFLSRIQTAKLIIMKHFGPQSEVDFRKKARQLGLSVYFIKPLNSSDNSPQIYYVATKFSKNGANCANLYCVCEKKGVPESWTQPILRSRSMKVTIQLTFGKKLVLKHPCEATYEIASRIEGKKNWMVQYSNEGRVCYIEAEATKDVVSSEHLPFNKDPKTAIQFYTAITGNPIEQFAGEIIKYDDLEEGMYIRVSDSLDIIVQEYNFKNQLRNDSEFAEFKDYPPPQKSRRIKDFILPTVNNIPLKRPTTDEYQRHCESTVAAWRAGRVPIMAADMGWGKTTYFLLNLLDHIQGTIYITLPNRRLAQELYATWKKIGEKFKVKVGKNINSEKEAGRIIIQTPFYLKVVEAPDVNVLDQYQFMSFHNIDAMTNRDIYNRVLLMSATPFVPLYGAIRASGLKFTQLIGEMQREKKRWFIRTTMRTDPKRVPSNTIIYSTKTDDHPDKDSANICGINATLTSRNSTGYLCHPNLCFGWSPSHPVTNIVIDFNRPVFTSTNNPQVVQRAITLPPEYEVAVQSCGRGARQFDTGACTWVSEVWSYTTHRINAPQIKNKFNQHIFNDFYEGYYSRSKMPSSRGLYAGFASILIKVVKGSIEIGGQKYKVLNLIDDKVASVAGITIIGSGVSAAIQAQGVGQYHIQEKIIPNPLIDVTTGQSFNKPGDLLHEPNSTTPLITVGDVDISRYEEMFYELGKLKEINVNAVRPLIRATCGDIETSRVITFQKRDLAIESLLNDLRMRANFFSSGKVYWARKIESQNFEQVPMDQAVVLVDNPFKSEKAEAYILRQRILYEDFTLKTMIRTAQGMIYLYLRGVPDSYNGVQLTFKILDQLPLQQRQMIFAAGEKIAVRDLATLLVDIPRDKIKNITTEEELVCYKEYWQGCIPYYRRFKCFRPRAYEEVIKSLNNITAMYEISIKGGALKSCDGKLTCSYCILGFFHKKWMEPTSEFRVTHPILTIDTKDVMQFSTVKHNKPSGLLLPRLILERRPELLDEIYQEYDVKSMVIKGDYFLLGTFRDIDVPGPVHILNQFEKVRITDAKIIEVNQPGSVTGKAQILIEKVEVELLPPNLYVENPEKRKANKDKEVAIEVDYKDTYDNLANQDFGLDTTTARTKIKIDECDFYKFSTEENKLTLYTKVFCECEKPADTWIINQLLTKAAGKACCYHCFKYTPDMAQGTTYSLSSLIRDLYALFRSPKGQLTVTHSWVRKLKLFIERRHGDQQIRKYIHNNNSDLSLELHRLYNEYAQKNMMAPATVLVSLAMAFVGVAALVYVLYPAERRPEGQIRRRLPQGALEAAVGLRAANIVQRGELIEVPRTIAPANPLTINYTNFHERFALPGKFDEIRGCNQERVNNHFSEGMSSSHITSHQAREIATAYVAGKYAGGHPMIELGSVDATWYDNTAMMVSNEYGKRFRHHRDGSVGVYGHYNLRDYDLFARRFAAFIPGRKKLLFARDSIHTPEALLFAFKAALDPNNRISAFVWITHQPLVATDGIMSHVDGAVLMKKSTMDGWVLCQTSMASQETMWENLPSYHEVQRLARLFQLKEQFTPIRYESNLVYGIWQFSPASSTYGSLMSKDYVNRIGDFVFDLETGVMCSWKNCKESEIYRASSRCQQVSMNAKKTTMGRVGEVKEQAVTIDVGFREKVRRWLTKIDFLDRSSNFLGRIPIYFNVFRSERNWYVFNAEPLPIEVSDGYCYIKQGYMLGQFEKNYLQALRATIEMRVSQEYNQEEMPVGTRIFGRPEAAADHCCFYGEENADWYDSTMVVRGFRDRTRRIQRSLKEFADSLPYQIEPIIFKAKVPELLKQGTIMEGTEVNCPNSFHVSRERYEDMIWNRTVLPKYRIKYRGALWELPQLPTYEELVQGCTCTDKTSKLLEVQLADMPGVQLEMFQTESCPVNLIYAVVGRQANARVSPDPQILIEYGDFTEWMLRDIVDKMREDDFKVRYDKESVEKYFLHVGTKDKKKEKAYRIAWHGSLDEKEHSDMFVKSGQNHAGWSWIDGSTRDELKARLINCPSMTVRARCGYVSYVVLTYMKKNYFEYFLGKDPEAIDQYMKWLEEFPHTYQADFSTYDATNNRAVREAWDATFFDFIYKEGLVDDVCQSIDPKNFGKKMYKVDDRKRVVKTKVSFTSQITIKGYKKTKCGSQGNSIALMTAKGDLDGTTYSGDPSATTNCGTGRNWSYHYFAIWRRRETFSFFAQLDQLELHRIMLNGTVRQLPSFRQVRKVVSKYVRMMFAGDDTGIMFKKQEDRNAMAHAMRELCADANEEQTHGLGLILKKPKNDFQRIDVLSRKMGIYKGETFCMRKLENLILTNSTQSKTLTSSEANYLAAMSLYSGSMDPLSKKLITLRLGMVNGVINKEAIAQNFVQNRKFKLGSVKEYSHEVAAFAYGLTLENYMKAVESLKLERGVIYVDSSIFKIPEMTSHTFKYGLYSNLHFHNTLHRYTGPKSLFQGQLNFVFQKPKQHPTMMKSIIKVLTGQNSKKQKEVLVTVNKREIESDMKKMADVLLRTRVYDQHPSRAQLDIQLMIGGIEPNPGPVQNTTNQIEAEATEEDEPPPLNPITFIRICSIRNPTFNLDITNVGT